MPDETGAGVPKGAPLTAARLNLETDSTLAG